MHVGTSPLQNSSYEVTKKNVLDAVDRMHGKTVESEKSELSQKSLFESYLVEALDKVNSQQVHVADLQKQVITDPDSVDIHDVTTAMAKAKMSMELAQNVIDRMIKGWTELSQSR